MPLNKETKPMTDLKNTKLKKTYAIKLLFLCQLNYSY